MQNYVLAPANGSDQADEWLRQGVSAHVAGNLPLAQQHYQQALRMDPRHALAAHNLAIVFAQSPGLINEALLTIERATMCDGTHAIIQVNRALMAMEAERIDEALTAAQKAVEMAPKDAQCLLVLAQVYATAGMPDKAVPLYEKILDSDPKHMPSGPNLCFIQTLTNATPADLLKARQRWWKANHYEGKPEKHRNDKDPDRVIRVGYVGGDFKRHSAAFIFANVLLHHTSAVEMYLYSSLPVDAAADPNTKKFQDAAHLGKIPGPGEIGQVWIGGSRWRDISAMSDEDADRLIRNDRIDILVDLAGHTNGGRLALFTRKPAPIQVTAWGFAHGTGCPEIDYFLADTVAVPEGERKDYAEKIIDLPCIVTMEPPVEYNLKAFSKPPIKQNDVFTFGSYARYEKMSDQCLRTFGEILRRVPESRMQFKDNAYRRPYAIKRIMRIMGEVHEQHGGESQIAPERLLFSLATSHPDHLLAYQQADLCLDPFQHGGGVVSLETLYMGVPLLTMYGTQPSGRTAASVLTAMGRTDWIARSPEEYIEKAVEWSGRLKELADARKTLREELLKSTVVLGYCESVEKAYKEMWRTWCEK